MGKIKNVVALIKGSVSCSVCTFPCTDIFEIIAVISSFVVMSHQGPFQLAAVGPQSIRTRVPQEVWSHRPLLLCQVIFFPLTLLIHTVGFHLSTYSM